MVQTAVIQARGDRTAGIEARDFTLKSHPRRTPILLAHSKTMMWTGIMEVKKNTAYPHHHTLLLKHDDGHLHGERPLIGWERAPNLDPTTKKDHEM